MNLVIIGVGSNIDKYANVKRAQQLVAQQFNLIKISNFSETDPVGPIADQDKFLNGAWLIETHLSLDELKHGLHQIEDQMGRDRSAPKWGPRNIDLDVVVWNGKIVDSDYYERAYLKQCVDELMN